MYLIPSTQVEAILEGIAHARKLAFDIDVMAYDYEVKMVRNQASTCAMIRDLCFRMNQLSRELSQINDFFSIQSFYRPDLVIRQ